MESVKPVKVKKEKAPPKTPEQRQHERRERFTKLAPARVNKALVALNNVARCGNRISYQYTEEEAAKICETLLDAATAVRDAFTPSKGGKQLFVL